MSPLLHLASEVDLLACQSRPDYVPAGFDREGFIHCCRVDQLAGVLKRWFRGRDDVALLQIDVDLLGTAPVEEDTAGRGETFPHLYRTLPWRVVTDRTPLRVDDAGCAVPRDGLRAEAGPLTLHAFWQPDCIRYSFQGRLTDDALLTAMPRIWRHPAYVFDRPELYDLRDVDPGSLSSTGVQRLAEISGTLFADRPLLRTALLVSGPLLFGFSRMFGAFAGPRGDHYQVFDRPDAARRWLADGPGV